MELYEKTLGIVGFGRIGQLVAARARGFEMRVVAFDPFVSAERYRELGVEKAENSEEIYAQADFITIHLPKTPETQNWLNAKAFAADARRRAHPQRRPRRADRRSGAAGRARLAARWAARRSTCSPPSR